MTRRSWEVAWRYVIWPLAAGVLFLLAGWTTGRRGLRRSGWCCLGAAGASLLFFRDPDRLLEPEPGVVYAAADGVVREVDEVDEPWMTGGRAARISTFLSLHNVHVNRSPVAGRVATTEQLDGGYAPALFGGSEANYRNRVLLEGRHGPVVLVQKAGMIARRISCWVEVGEEVKAGQRVGLIHFGSRTDVLLPPGETEPLVGPGSRVRAGITPLARYRSPDRNGG